MKVIQYQTSYSSLRLKSLGIRAALIGLVLALSTCTWLVLNHYSDDLSLYYRLPLLIISYVGIGVLYYYSRPKYVDEVFNNFIGKRGEDQIATLLQQHFDDSYTYIRNYVIPQTRIGDIDGLLINSKEVIIIEIKYYSGEFEIINGVFFKCKKNRLYRLWNNPINQVEKQKNHLVALLKQRGLDMHVKTFVALAHGRVKNIKGHTGVYVLTKDNLVDIIQKEIVVPHPSSTMVVEHLLEILAINNF